MQVRLRLSCRSADIYEVARLYPSSDLPLIQPLFPFAVDPLSMVGGVF